jgi:hypothetical protein
MGTGPGVARIGVALVLALWLAPVLAEPAAAGSLVVYDEAGGACNHFEGLVVSGDAADLEVQDDWSLYPCAGIFSIRLAYEPAGPLGYAAAEWVHPEDGPEAGVGLDLGWARVLRFGARGELGGERVRVYMRDGAGRERAVELELAATWSFYEIELEGAELSSVATGFGVRLAAAEVPGGAVVYFDDITYEPAATGLLLHGNRARYGPGDRFALEYDLVGPEAGEGELYIALAYGGRYWFWPAWTEAVAGEAVSLAPDPACAGALAFRWPDLDAAIPGIVFWGVLLDAEGLLLGDVQRVSIDYQPDR